MGVGLASEASSQLVLDVREWDHVDNLTNKGGSQKASGSSLVDAALLHVEELGGVYLSCRGAVGAFDIVGINLELWLGIGASLTRCEHMAVGLLGCRLLGFGLDENQAAKSHTTIAMRNAFEKLRGRGMACIVLDKRLVVNQLTIANDVEPIEAEIGTFIMDTAFDLVAHKGGMEVYKRDIGMGVGSKIESCAGEDLLVGLAILKDYETERCASSHIHFELQEESRKRGDPDDSFG